MSYSLTRQFNLTAASTAFADIIAALITHFQNDSVLWELSIDHTPLAGEALTINPIGRTDITTCIWRQGTSTSLCVLVDPLNEVSQGSASVDSTGSTSSFTCKTKTMTGYNVDFLVIEHETAITILFQDNAKSFVNYGIHAGIIYVPNLEDGADYGMTGHGAEVGAIAASGTNCWTSTSVQTDGSRVRVMNDGNGTNYAQIYSPDMANCWSSPGQISSISPDGTVRLMSSISVLGNNLNGAGDFKVGEFKYLKSAPVGTSPSVPGQLPKTVASAGRPVPNQGWMYIENNASTGSLVINCELNGVFL